MKSLRPKYYQDHPVWPNTHAQAIMEISNINDLLSEGGLTKAERNWGYARRKKLQKYLNDEEYRKKVYVGKTDE